MRRSFGVSSILHDSVLTVNRKTYEDFETKQQEFHKRLEKSRRFNKNGKRAIRCRTNDDVHHWITQAEELHSDFEERHSRGPRKWVRKYQSFSDGVSAFMTDIEPLLDIVKGLGPPYSGIAVGTVCGLFTVSSE